MGNQKISDYKLWYLKQFFVFRLLKFKFEVIDLWPLQEKL